MKIYLDVVILLNFLIDFFLLVGAARLAGMPGSLGKAALSAALGAVYAGACLIPGFQFLGNLLWRMVVLGAMGTLAFGVCREALRCTVLFVFLAMSLGGIALGLGNGSFLSLSLAAAGVLALCILGFHGKVGQSYLPIEVTRNGNTVRVNALIDTGNTLTDPVTGEGVLVIGAQAAGKLTGLSQEQLSQPVQTMSSGVLPGLRLIPYRAVGQPCGMLLAMRFENVKLGKKRRCVLVAFAPEGLEAGGCQALIGGMV